MSGGSLTAVTWTLTVPTTSGAIGLPPVTPRSLTVTRTSAAPL
jgi:hypothetical protein